MHILPKGFVRIRHYGFLSSTSKRVYLKELQNQPGKPINLISMTPPNDFDKKFGF